MSTIAPIELFVVAHHDEARGLIEKGEFYPFPLALRDEVVLQNLYRNSNGSHFLLVTGEGIPWPATKLTSFLSCYPGSIARIVNVGIAGGVGEGALRGQIYRVSEVFHEFEKASFKLVDQNNKSERFPEIRCLTIGYVLSDQQKSRDLQECFGQDFLVDQELWGIAQVARFFRIPVISYKLVSDTPWKESSGFIDFEAIHSKFSFVLE